VKLLLRHQPCSRQFPADSAIASRIFSGRSIAMNSLSIGFLPACGTGLPSDAILTYSRHRIIDDGAHYPEMISMGCKGIAVSQGI